MRTVTLPTKNERGFTLIELLVVIGILAVLMAVTIAAINPVKHFQDTRNAQRQSDVTTILDAVYEDEIANRGGFPAGSKLAGITAGTTYDITSTAGANNIDLCTDLVTAGYVADLPMDPKTGTRSSTTTCGGTYDTKYSITQSSSNNRFTVAATAEPSGTISVTR